MYKHWSKAIPVALACLLVMAPAVAQSYADRLRGVAERAVKSEVERKVDREVRKATRCVLGDDRCVQEAQRRGEQVEIVQVGTPAPVYPGSVVQSSYPQAGHAVPATASDAGAMASGLDRDGRIILGGLRFDTARATLHAESSHALDQAARLLRQQPQLRLLIVGHTDSTGSMTTNQRLSQQRAESVRDALVGRGIAPARLTPAGAGSSTPVANNATEAGRALNRRVELVRQ